MQDLRKISGKLPLLISKRRIMVHNSPRMIRIFPSQMSTGSDQERCEREIRPERETDHMQT